MSFEETTTAGTARTRRSMTTAVAAPIDWERLARLKFHPTRVRLIEIFALAEEPRSPVSLAQEMDERLGNVSYHVRALVDEGLIELDRTVPRRGAVEHFYRLVEGVVLDG